MNQLLVIDTETTGLDPENNRILQIAAKVYVGKEAVAEFCTNVSVTEGEVSLAALKVNRVSINSLDSYGIPERLALSHFFDFVMRNLKSYPDMVICGMNVSFDLAFIKSAAKRLRLNDVEAILPRKVVDTQIIAQALKLAGIIDVKSVKSEALYDYFGVKYDKTAIHSAKEDVEKTADLYFRLNKLLTLLPIGPSSE